MQLAIIAIANHYVVSQEYLIWGVVALLVINCFDSAILRVSLTIAALLLISHYI